MDRLVLLYSRWWSPREDVTLVVAHIIRDIKHPPFFRREEGYVYCFLAGEPSFCGVYFYDPIEDRFPYMDLQRA